MNTLSISLSALAASLCIGCHDSGNKTETSELDMLVGKNVLISLSQPIAYSWEMTRATAGNPSRPEFNYEQMLRAKLIKVEPSGIIIKLHDREVWIRKEAVVSVIVIPLVTETLEK